MSLHPTARSFRRAAFGSALAASIVATASLFPSAASAIELKDVTLKTDCRLAALDRVNNLRVKFVKNWDLKCVDKQKELVRQETKTSLQREKESIQRAEASARLGACVSGLGKFNDKYKTEFASLVADFKARFGEVSYAKACDMFDASEKIRARLEKPVAASAKATAG